MVDSLNAARPTFQVRDGRDASVACDVDLLTRAAPDRAPLLDHDVGLGVDLGGEGPVPAQRFEREPVDPELGRDLVKDRHVRGRLAVQHAAGQPADRLADPVDNRPRGRTGPPARRTRGCS